MTNWVAVKAHGILKDGEAAPGVTFREIAARRARLAERLPDNSVVLLPSAQQQFVTGVIPYPYRQSADFYYLTGIRQTGVVLLHKRSGSDVTYTLFKNETSDARAFWDGADLSSAAALQVFGCDEVLACTEAVMRWRLAALLPSVSAVFRDADHSCAVLERAFSTALLSVNRDRPAVQPLRSHLHALRWRKSPAEIAALRRSVTAAAASLQLCMAHTQPGLWESDLAALFRYRCELRGAQGLAYPTVAGAGRNACTIHYGRADAQLQAGDVMLMDAGCELWGYCSDVTRTWPIAGPFSAAQRDVYGHVAEVHSACLAALRPGATLRDVHALSLEMLSARAAALRLPGHIKHYYPHSIGHWIGLDTHDCAEVPQDTPLEEGVALTIEPGLYLARPDVPRSLRNIGVRIEDVVVVTKDGAEVLSAGAPAAVDDVEAAAGARVGESMPVF